MSSSCIKNFAAVTAYTLAKELLVDESDRDSKEILQTSYSNFLVNKGVDRNGVSKLIERGEVLYKTVK